MRIKAKHLTSEEVLNEVHTWADLPAQKPMISNEAAVTIASWFQTSGGNGAILAAFASGCNVDPRRLSESVSVELGLFKDQPALHDEYLTLQALEAWVSDRL